jgi:hypothetical protein
MLVHSKIEPFGFLLSNGRELNMSDLKLEITQPMLKLGFTDSGATLPLEDLPASVGGTISFEVRSLEGTRGAL